MYVVSLECRILIQILGSPRKKKIWNSSKVTVELFICLRHILFVPFKNYTRIFVILARFLMSFLVFFPSKYR
jgi:hypothetical protein